MSRTLANIEKELQVIRKKGRVEANTIKVVEKNDHYNISLWTQDGKRKGPMHPHNAEKVLMDFAKRGVNLTATQPTPQQIAEYMQTDEYKQKMEEHKKRREAKEQSRTKGGMKKVLEQMSQMTGMTVEALQKVSGGVTQAPEGIKAAPAQPVDPEMIQK